MEKEIKMFIENKKEHDEEMSKNYYERDVKKLKELELKENIIENNIIKKFIDEEFENVINTLKKYQNKRIGEKTKEKIKNEIKNLDKTFEYVTFYHGYYNWDSKNYTLKINLASDLFRLCLPKIEINFTYWKSTDYNIEYNDEYIIDINGYKKEKYQYIEDIDILVNNIISESNELKEEIERTKKELNNKISTFESKYNYMITKETITFKYL